MKPMGLNGGRGYSLLKWGSHENREVLNLIRDRTGYRTTDLGGQRKRQCSKVWMYNSTFGQMLPPEICNKDYHNRQKYDFGGKKDGIMKSLNSNL